MSIPAPHHYIDAFMAAVPTTKQAAYRQHVAEMAPLFKQHGALFTVHWLGRIARWKAVEMREIDFKNLKRQPVAVEKQRVALDTVRHDNARRGPQRLWQVAP